MDKVNLHNRWAAMTTEQRQEMAESLVTTVNYLSQVCNGHAAPSKLMRHSISKYLGLKKGQELEIKTAAERKSKSAA